MSESRFTIKKVEPDQPVGSVIIDYDPDKDILWIGRSCDESGDEHLHSKGDLLFDPNINVIITINNEGPGPWFISSIALINASRHLLWPDLFRGLEFCLRERKKLKFTVDPSPWDLK